MASPIAPLHQPENTKFFQRKILSDKPTPATFRSPGNRYQKKPSYGRVSFVVSLGPTARLNWASYDSVLLQVQSCYYIGIVKKLRFFSPVACAFAQTQSYKRRTYYLLRRELPSLKQILRSVFYFSSSSVQF